MAKECYDMNLLANSGTNQLQRSLAALKASYATPDERSLSALILFAKKYGAYLNYYDLSNNCNGTWQQFMENDVAVATAVIASLNTSDYSIYINNLYDYIIKLASHEVVPGYPDIQQTLNYIFDLIASISSLINQSLINIPDDVDYQEFLSVTIGSKLAAPLQLLADYYINYLPTIVSTLPPSNPASSATDPAAPVDIKVTIFELHFLTDSPWNYFILGVNPLYSISYDPLSSNEEKYKQIITDPIFTGTINSFLDGVSYIVEQTENTYLNELLTQYNNHTPHYALFLSFLKLFNSAQDHLNHFTGKHLEFYYKDVLKLVNNKGIPDMAHIAFTLQKNTVQHLLNEGTQLKAGKDADNHDLFYALSSNIVLNQATIDSLKSLLILKNNAANAATQTLYDSPIANSADGQGGKITNPEKSWYAFGDLNNNSFTASTAAIGFAIASNILYLNEGQRTITITFSGSNSTNQVIAPTPFSNNAPFSVKFTGPNKWFDASDYIDNTNSSLSVNSDGISLTIVITGNAPSIVPYSQKIHGGNFPQSLPMMQVELNDYEYYSQLKTFSISKITIDVTVDRVQNLVLQNDDGAIDASKPFKPFGAFPDIGANFIIGSKEIFQKMLLSLTLNINSPTSPGPTDSVNLSYLSEGSWTPAPAISSTLDTLDFSNLLTNSKPNPNIPSPDFTPNQPYAASSINGFVCITLEVDTYGLSNYLAKVQAAAATNTVTITTTPGTDTTQETTTFQLNAPATPTPQPGAPVATSISIGYTAEISFLDDSINPQSDFNARQHYFFHIEPFGFREMHPYLLSIPSTIDATLQDNMMNFLPVFNMNNETANDPSDNGVQSGTDNEGELWIGLKNATPDETHSILFQLSEGSSNPLKNAATVTWFYLSSNNWISLSDSVVDKTNNLSQSGLVVLPLPGDETMDNTRAGAGLIWVKAVVQQDTDAVCRIIEIVSNTAEAVFVQGIPNKIEFKNNITAGTISKLVNADASIKQVSQPYPSVGGTPVETNVQFNQRVSERLRHKRRAVTSWDYERLVLQNFPEIHKVKCLDHSDLNTDTQAYSELKPGNVLIVTIPDLSLLTGSNPYLPFTNVGLLTRIKQFLTPLTSPFVNLNVVNPQFEAIQVDFKVTFKKGLDENFYKAQLDTDIRNFLMPWISGGQDINFGGTIEKSSILNFVQSCSYVDFVTCFKMYQIPYSESGFETNTTDIDVAVATTARSIFVPFYVPGIPPIGNIIKSPADCNCNGQ